MEIKKCRICGFIPKDNGIDIFRLYDDVFCISHICHTGNNRKHCTAISIYDENKERCIEIWNKLNEEVK